MLFEKVFFVLFLTKIIFSTDNLSGEKKLNVVMFLAKPPDSPIWNDVGLKYLDFQKKARVKHCADNSGNNVDDLAQIMSTESDCKQLLKAGIFSLISYCRNVMGMTTAIASLENDTFSDGLRFKKSSTGEDLEIIFVNPKKKSPQLPRDIPMFNLFPPSRRLRFNNINKWSRRSGIITQPEHTEIFKIRSKKHAPLVKRKEVKRINNKKRCDTDNPKWDIFGIIATIKLTFFGKLLEDDDNKVDVSTNKGMNQLFSDREKNKGMDSIGEVEENPLFDLVKQTLSSIQEVCESGFLMIVIGGNLKDICDPYSSLVQSIKHVTENTDDDNTLIVVTGSCPEEPEEFNSGKTENLIPVYVKGPATCTGISSAAALYDVPYSIKNIVADTNIAGSFISKVNPRRRKRDSGDSAQNKAEKYYPSTIISLLIIILHINHNL